MPTQNPKRSPERPATIFKWLYFMVVAVTLAIVCWSRLTSEYFDRILETDELITLQNYTWLGIQEDGSRRELQSIDELSSKESLSLRRLALGIYCATGRWTEPNNHIPYSLSVSAALCLPFRGEICVRLPALLFAVAFAISLARLSVWAGLHRSWGIVCVLAFCHPYVATFSQTGRGYTLALWLCTESLRLALNLLEGQQYGRRNALLLGLVGVLQIANLVNMMVDWVAPVLAALLAIRCRTPMHPGSSVLTRLSQVWDEFSVAVVMIATFSISFVLDRFPFLFSSAQQYGVPWLSTADLSSYLFDLQDSFASGIWSVLVVAGGCGLVAGGISSDWRIRGGVWLGLAAVTATSLHFAVAGKFAYTRNLGFAIPLIVFGIGILFEQSANRVRLLNRPWTCSTAAIALTLASGLTGLQNPPAIDKTLARLTDALEALPLTENNEAVIWGRGVAEPSRLYLSGRVRPVSNYLNPNSDSQFELSIIEKAGFAVPLNGQETTANAGKSGISGVGPYRIRRFHARASGVNDANLLRQTSAHALIWKANDGSLPVSPASIIAPLQNASMTFVEINERYQAKLDVFSRLDQVLVPITDESVRSKVRSFEFERLQTSGHWFELFLE